MYYFGKDFEKESEIQSLLEDFLKQKKLKDKKQYNNIQTGQKK